MAEGMFGKVKRNLSRAFDFSSSADIRNKRDADETTANLDYMTSRGKNRTTQDQSDVPAGQRRSRGTVAPEPIESPNSPVQQNIDKIKQGIAGPRKRLIDALSGQSSNTSPGVASNAMKQQASSRGPMDRSQAPAVQLFKRLRKKQPIGAQAQGPAPAQDERYG